MIYVTVGSQLPFDRLVAAVVAWAGARGRTDLFIQHAGFQGDLGGLPNVDFLDAPSATRRMAEADVVVSHVGTGTMLACLELGKPCIVLPRQVRFGEVRNDHQTAHARRFESRALIHVAWTEDEIAGLLDRVKPSHGGSSGERIPPTASRELLEAVRAFLWEGRG